MKLVKYICALLAVSFLISCSKGETDRESVYDGKTKIDIKAQGFGQHFVTTRATVKDPDETEIHNLHIFFFDNKTGEYLKPSLQGSEEGKNYRFLDGGKSTLLIDGEQFENPADVDIYVLANLKENTITVDENGIPVAKNGIETFRISNRDKLIEYIYLPYDKADFTTIIPLTGLPMVGNAKGNFTIKGGNVIDVKLKSLMARVDFNITLAPKDINEDLRYPILQITEVEMHNMPAGARVGEYAAGSESSGAEICGSEGNTNINLRTGESKSFHFYVFEHLRKTNGNTIPSDVPDEYKQRYKPELAKDDAAYVLLKGKYTDNNGHPYNIAYRLYLGENHTDDFNIVRNCKYVNNIKVLGISAIDHPDDPNNNVGLDTRVTVSRESNDYYITILRERRHDSHFNITPMDVYIPGKGTIEISIPDADGENKWIRLEAVDGTPDREGFGKREYFTTDLLTKTLNNPQNKSCIIDGTEPGLTVRRVYIYIDENATTSARGADIDIYFTPTGGTRSQTPVQTLHIEQAGLLKATIDDGGTMRTVYMETYEEYLNYYDPMSNFNTPQKYEGLPWGASEEIGGIGNVVWGVFSGTFCSQNFTRGNDFTPYILDKIGGKDMTLADKPTSAAAYCYNKNKRDASGKVAKVEWYLPGIREMEQTLLAYYNVFPEFQDKFYWSSAAGEEKNFGVSTIFNTYNEDVNRARATKVTYYPGGASNPNAPGNVNWNGEYCYIKSGTDDVGWKPRTDICRIRCMRIADGVTTK